MKWEISLILAAAVLSLPSGNGLRCYTCLFPTISPLECLKFEQGCPPGQRCSSMVATGHRGDFQFVLRDRGCSMANLCDKNGIRTMMGINFTYQSTCCDIDLCNTALRSSISLYTQRLAATLALASSLFPCW